MQKPTRVALAAAVAALAYCPPALAEEAPDIAELAKFIRWGGVFLSLFVLVGAFLVLRVISRVAEEFSRRFSSQRMLIQKLESVARFAIYMLATSLIVGLSVRLDSTALTLIGGALAFAVGFAMRDLVAAFIAGITIMFDRPFQVGDRVTFGGQYGDIVKIGLRSVRMLTLDHLVVTIPNNKVLTEVASSGNYGELETLVPLDFYVGADQDLELASSLIEEACLTSRFCYLEKNAPVTIKQLIIDNYVAFRLRARPYVLDVKYEEELMTDVHKRVQKAFRERGILPPAMLHRELARRAE